MIQALPRFHFREHLKLNMKLIVDVKVQTRVHLRTHVRCTKYAVRNLHKNTFEIELKGLPEVALEF